MTNTNTNTESTFEVGSVYEMRFITDSDLRVKFICTKRTAKTATFERFQGTETFSKKIHTYDNSEYVKYDTYSMAPVIKASYRVL
jgi:hypothetical protein